MKNEHSEKITPLSKDPAGIQKRMQQARIDRGLALSQLSELSGVRPIVLSAIENGRMNYSLHDLNRARKALGVSLSYVMDGEEGLKKAYSTNEEYWVTDKATLLDFLMVKLHAENIQGLIGAEYFEGDQVPVTTEELVDIDTILYFIGDNAYDIMGEHAEDYPNLDEEEKKEFKELIVSFLDKKDPHGFFKIKNVVKKTITAEDLEATP
jgi:transcriptional regulator with XRE-family HTH domain